MDEILLMPTSINFDFTYNYDDCLDMTLLFYSFASVGVRLIRRAILKYIFFPLSDLAPTVSILFNLED